MQKLWQKNTEQLDTFVEWFETKDDLLFDHLLIPYDVAGSLAHAKMLTKLGILTDDELKKIAKGLQSITALAAAGKFTLSKGDEDIHTKIENYLVSTCGEVGKKIHTARSRNDQVLTALRLYYKAELLTIQKSVQRLSASFKDFGKQYGAIPMPGYTHMQKAMPMSIGMWSESFVAALEDDNKNLQTAYNLVNQSPLGSAAGFGVPITIDRKYTAKLLGFGKVQANPLYCQHSRGKFEATIISALIQVLLTINTFASDVLLFTTSEFGFFTASAAITTGSSIMPQKKNLDLAELLRSKVHLLLGNFTQIVSLRSNLISGYNRDLQDSKKPLVESLQLTKDCLKATQVLLTQLTPNKKVLEKAMTAELYATQKALQLVMNGENFRDAYQTIGQQY